MTRSVLFILYYLLLLLILTVTLSVLFILHYTAIININSDPVSIIYPIWLIDRLNPHMSWCQKSSPWSQGRKHHPEGKNVRRTLHTKAQSVEVFGAFGLTVSEKKTETLLMRTPEKAQQPGETPTPPLPALEIAAAGQKYHQVHQFVYLGGLITEDADITRDINRRTKIAWGCFRKFSTELFDRPNAPLRLKARLLKAEAMEALLYGCMTWAPRNAHYRQLRTTHHKLLLRVIGYHRVHGTYRKMSYAKALKKTGSQSVEATIRQRRLLFAGALARQDDKRLPKRLLFAERLEGGQDPGPGQPAQHWQKSLRDDFKAFGALHGSTPSDRRIFGVDRLVWTEAARKGEGAPWYTGVLLGAERFMASWHKSEEEASKLREVNRAA